VSSKLNGDLRFSESVVVFLGSLKVTILNSTAKLQSKFHLKYLFLRKAIDPNLRISFNPKDSDFAFHEIILNAVVGTLIKYGEDGRLESYLAKTFDVSSNGKRIAFHLHDNLTCEDGTKITAALFVRNLTQNLKRYSERSGMLDFELLDGWTEFKSEIRSEIQGLYSKENSVIFEFKHPPENFFEFLRMPYFGFWCEANFSNGIWKDDQKIISSGPYKLEFVRGHEVQLSLRKEWFSVNEDSPELITFKYAVLGNESEHTSQTIAEVSSREKPEEDGTVINGIPTLMLSMVLSPFKEGPFQNVDNRRAFVQRIKEIQNRSSIFNSTSFYPATPSKAELQSTFDFSEDMKEKTIRVAFPSRNFSDQEIEMIKQMTEESLRSSGANVEFTMKDPLEDNWRQRLLSNREFDIRLNGVDIGAGFQNFAIKMIFCSNMGVSYPDPSGRICKLVEEYDESNKPVDFTYSERFNQILFEDAVVVPLVHYGTKWIISDDIDANSIPPTIANPLFENIRLK
jgi:ABC-type transport system substrate-binding protein